MRRMGKALNLVDVFVGDNVKLQRMWLGLEQSFLADALGILLPEFQDCERGRCRFGAERLLKVARLLNVSAEDFFKKIDYVRGVSPVRGREFLH
jgi:hypothetical protein